MAKLFVSGLLKCSCVLACVLFTSMVMNACKSKNEIEVVDTNFKDEVEQQQNLIFQFNKEIFSDTALDVWDSTTYIEFEPRVPGSYRWKSSNELVFSPERSFLPGTEYKAVLSTKLLHLAGARKKNYKLSSKKVLSFHTAPLRVENVHTKWTRGKEAASVMAQLDLNFNYEVDVTQAATRLKLSVNGKSVPFNTVVSTGFAKTLSVQLLPVGDKEDNTRLKVELGSGIGIVGSKVSSKRDTAFTTELVSRYKLKIGTITSQHDGLQGVVNIPVSQPVFEADVKPYIRFEPHITFDVAANDDGLVITSPAFDPKVTYNITISKDLQGAYGGKLEADAVQQVMFGTLEPSLNFINIKGMYLSSRGYRSVALNIVEVPKVKLTVIKVYENNIYELFRRGQSWDYEYEQTDEDEYDYKEYQYYSSENIGDTIYTQTYDVSKLPKNNAAHLLQLDFSDKLKSYDGVYIICVGSTEHKWVQQSKILSLSDIGLICKQEDNKIYVFANSIRNATPISDAKISFISTNNQKIFTASTDKSGVAVFDNIKEKAPGFNVGMITARHNDEYSFITFSKSEIETSRFDVGGRKINAMGLNAWIYAERNLYRPGETVNASIIVRNESWLPPGEMPVKLRLVMPNGKEFANRRKVLNEQGSAAVDFAIPPTAITGNYSLEVYSGNDVLLNAYNVTIEDFMPDRIKMEVKINKEDYIPGDVLNCLIKADNLFGTPAANRKYEWELNIDKSNFQPKGYEQYNFAIIKDFDYTTAFRSGTTNETGEASETAELDNALSGTGLLKGNVHVTVFDEIGRPVHRFANFRIYTQPTFIGIKNPNSYVSTRKPMQVQLVALQKNESPATQKATITVVRKEWQNVLQQSGSSYKYVSKWVEKVVATQSIIISGSGTSFSFTPQVSGEYEIRVAAEGSEDAYVSEIFYAYGFSDTQYASFEVNNEGNVTIKANKESYNPGESIQLLFTTPFEGRMLVSIERDKVLEYHFLNTSNKSASLNVKASDLFLPNVYVAATLFRPMDVSDMPLTVAHGYKNIRVEAKQNKIPLSIKVNETSRSKTRQRISIKTAPGAYVTVAAVDEGILQVKNYKSPDPYNYFYQKVALGVNSYDIYPLLLPEYNASKSSTGGDGAENDQAGRVNPVFVNRVKNVSFWSGILKADGSGNVQYDIDVPQFSGAIRVMAVAYKDKAFGSYDNYIKIADPIVISAALPRFFSPGDEAMMPVTLSNTTNKDAQAQVQVLTQGAAGVAVPATQTVTVPANREARVVFHITASNQIGAAKVLVNVKALNENFSNETDIAVRPPASLQKINSSGIVNAGTGIALPLSNNFIPGTFSGSLTVANTPLVQFSRNLSYLINYPYGCVEQTTSAAFPQLYYADLVKSITGKEDKDINPAYNVQQALLKLQAMQLPNGSLSYWPGGNYESWWGSVFAAHFMLEAQKAGYEVNAATVQKLLDYMKFRLRKKENIEYYYNNGQRKTIAAKEIPYSLYVLALARQPQESIMNYYKGNMESLSLDGRYLLAAAYALSGQHDKARQVTPASFSGEKSESQFGGSFYSYNRDKAIALNALLDVNPQNPQVADLARQISEELRRNPYLNTQENVFAVLALGKIARKTAGDQAVAQVTANGKVLTTTKGPAVHVDLKALLNQNVKVSVSGKGSFYYFKEIKGISTDGSVKEEDSYLKVRRSYFTRNGQQITDNNFRQNDLIVVRITIEGSYRSTIDNVVITDMLPAGLEIENTRLNEMPNLKWVTERKDKDDPDYLDIRDDRLNIFTSVHSRPKTFYYMVRAVSPGTYKLGPVQADAMYNGMYHSYHGAGVVKVLP